MATNLFTKAAAYRKKYKGMSMADAVKAVAKKNKPAKKAAAKKSHTAAKKKTATRKVAGAKKAAPKKKAAIKKVRTTVTISGVSLQKVRMEHQHQQALQTAITRHQAQLKDKGLKPAEKAHIRREIANYRYALSASKKHVTALKRTI